MPGDVSFLELGSREADSSRAFFQHVFGWSFNPLGASGWFQAPSMRIGLHGNDPQPQIYVFLEVPDLEAAMALVREAGGQADSATSEPGFGRFSSCLDPQGIRFGLHQKT